MSVAEAGPLPWSESFGAFAYKGKGSRKAKQAQRTLGLRWNNKLNKWQQNKNHGIEGTKEQWADYYLSDRKLLGDLSDDYKNTHKLTHTSGAADYVDYSFSVDKEHVESIEGCGHITSLSYNALTQVLKVAFATNGNVVCYFSVPSTVVGELFEHAKTKDKGYNGKHILGTRFWDLIRIRGNIHGTRYQFVYTEDNGYVNADGVRSGEGHSEGARWAGRRVSDAIEKIDKRVKEDGKKGMTDKAADKYEDAIFDEHNLDRSFVTVINEKHRPITVFRDDANLLSKADRIKLGEAYDAGLDIDQLNALFSKLHNK